MPSDLYADCICIANKLLTIPFGIIAGVFCGADENPEPFAPGVPELIAQLQASRTGAEGRGANPTPRSLRSTPCHAPLCGRQRDRYFGILTASGGRPPQSGCPNAGSHLHLRIHRLVCRNHIASGRQPVRAKSSARRCTRVPHLAAGAAAIASRFMR